MELMDPINLNQLLQNPIMFRMSNDLSIANNDEDLIDNSDDHENPDAKPTPWLMSFNELKKTMTKIPKYNIYKRIICEGTGEVCGTRKCQIQWSYSVFFEKEEHSYDSSYLAGTSVKTTLSDELLVGLWYAIETMRKQEESHFIIDYRLMYGSLGHLVGDIKVPKKADVLLVAKLIDFREVGDANACNGLTDDELRQLALIKDKIGKMITKMHDFYRKGFYAHAISLSMKIIQHLQFCDIDTEDESKTRDHLLAVVFDKLIDCYIKTEDYKRAGAMIKEFRRFTNVNKNINVLINEAIVYSKIDDDYGRSIELLRKAQKLDPCNDRVNCTLEDFEKLHENYKNYRSNFAKRIFQLKSQAKDKSHSKTEINKPTIADVEEQIGELIIESYTATEN